MNTWNNFVDARRNCQRGHLYSISPQPIPIPKYECSKWYFMMQKYEADQSTTLSCPLLPTNYKLILVFNYFHNWSLSINNHLDDCVFSCLVFLSTTNINAKKSVTCWAEKYAEIYTSQCYIFPIFKVRDLISKFQKIGELKNGLKFFV